MATEWYFSPTGNDSNNGTSPSTPKVHPELITIGNGDTLNMSAGIFNVNMGIIQAALGNAWTMQGAGRSLTRVNGFHQDGGIFLTNGAPIVLNDCTLANTDSASDTYLCQTGEDAGIALYPMTFNRCNLIGVTDIFLSTFMLIVLNDCTLTTNEDTNVTGVPNAITIATNCTFNMIGSLIFNHNVTAYSVGTANCIGIFVGCKFNITIPAGFIYGGTAITNDQGSTITLANCSLQILSNLGSGTVVLIDNISGTVDAYSSTFDPSLCSGVINNIGTPLSSILANANNLVSMSI